MASSKDRQRKLARAKLDRQLARRAAAERRKRRTRATVGAGLAVVLIAVGAVWLFGGFDGDDETATAQDQCTWTPQDATTNSNLKDVGTPPTKDLPTKGTRLMTVVTPGGDITAELQVDPSVCGTASLAYLAEKNFYDNTKCHELTETYLRCGDPSGTGQGGPTYAVFGENVPAPSGASPSASPAPAGEAAQYPKGTIALVATTPGSYGSQFLIFHKDLSIAEPAYTIVGNLLGGQAVLDQIVKAGTVANESGEKTKPAKDVTVTSVRVDEARTAGTPAPTPPAGPTPSATAQS
ncbi:peptidylprolyl isomerase [Actinophytocola sp.]|uniref:peptidylprolyl isomerase n=1 Tax=Actinophytocola sp. TaxID=1872138 RepID=UPI002D7E9F52|nr:peptidylprolyl isomerase [Actinophytocola sp.]HET9142783.1 peptidylprolyl isomerase [Actinophytocola sp.]HEU5109573.1 peptidylprolyl isomerase [Micromonosporaceae bacterium]